MEKNTGLAICERISVILIPKKEYFNLSKFFYNLSYRIIQKLFLFRNI